MLVVRSLWLWTLQVASAVSTDEARSCMQHHAVHRQALLQIHRKVNTKIGPGFLGDQKPDRAASEVVPAREDALPGNGALAPPPPPAVGRGLASMLAAVQARAVESADPGQHSLQLLDPGQATTEDPVSVQLDRTVSDAGNVMGLFAAGVAAGTRAAIDNAIPGDWWAGANVSTAPTGSMAGAEHGGSPGAMSFFSSAAKITGSRQEGLRRQPRAASLLVLAATSGAGAGRGMRAVEHQDATGTLVEVLAPMRGVATEEEQQRTLSMAQQRQQQRSTEMTQAEALESQMESEEDMVKTMGSSWGI